MAKTRKTPVGTATDAPTPPGDVPAGVAQAVAGATAKFRSRLLSPAEGGYRTVRASSLKIHPKNWRTHPEYQSTAVRKILERIGWVDALKCRELPDGSLELFDGHLRRDLAEGEEVPVLVSRLTDAETDEILAMYDQVSTLAVPDVAKLADLLGGLKAIDVPLVELGWPQYKLDQLTATVYTPPAGVSNSDGDDRSNGAAQPPAEFPAVGEDIKTEHCCPKCGYRWSGKSS